MARRRRRCCRRHRRRRHLSTDRTHTLCLPTCTFHLVRALGSHDTAAHLQRLFFIVFSSVNRTFYLFCVSVLLFFKINSHKSDLFFFYKTVK